MISQAVEYSLRAMVYLTQKPEGPATVQEIAAKGKIPAPYLSKLLQGLTRAGLVVAQRGIGGGYILSRPASEISLADIVNVVEPLQRIKTCPLGIGGHANLCPLHSRLDQALATIERAFQETSLDDLCKEKGGSIPLCDEAPSGMLEIELVPIQK